MFTHGATMDHGLFDYQVEHFADRYKVINWDVPAHGLSRPYRDFSLQNSSDVLFELLQKEKVIRAHPVGQSMGGYISQVLAADHPEIVDSLTVIGSSPIQLSYYSLLDRWLLAITPDLLKFYKYETMINLIASQIAITSRAKDYALKTLSGMTRTEISTIMGAVYGGLIQYDKGTLDCPVLITYGDADRTGKVKQYCDRWSKSEDRRLRVIPQAAHNANMDNPEGFNAILDEFLTTLK